MRVCGMAAALTGLEKGFETGDEKEINLSIKRMTLLYAVSIFIGGIPLIYLGDELTSLNDYSYKQDPAKKGDSRWVHRVPLDPNAMARRKESGSVENRMFSNIKALIGIRIDNHIFEADATHFHDTGNPHLFAFTRENPEQKTLFIGNFSEHHISLNSDFIRDIFGSGHTLKDLWSGNDLQVHHHVPIDPYQIFVLSL
jgi:amylosucrase/maltose alpha-D-glucosyltransferase/alpha-amylase